MLKPMSFLFALLIGGISLVPTSPANAELIRVPTFLNPLGGLPNNQGWWNNKDPNTNPTNSNYFVGRDLVDRDEEFRNYFSFDLSGVTSTVVSARLEVRRFTSREGGIYQLFDVSTSAEDLARRLIVDLDVFNDLGTGTTYGTFNIGAGESEDLLSFTLNDAALFDINASLGSFFSIGGVSVNSVSLFLFSSSEGIQRLTLETEDIIQVPEPTTVGLFGLGLAGLGVLSRRRKRSGTV